MTARHAALEKETRTHFLPLSCPPYPMQRKLLRAGAALSLSPYISTFLDLELPPTSDPLALDASLAPATHADAPFAAATEGAAWSATCMGGGQHGALLGRVLLQNQGSLSYWGKLTSRNKTGEGQWEKRVVHQRCRLLVLQLWRGMHIIQHCCC